MNIKARSLIFDDVLTLLIRDGQQGLSFIISSFSECGIIFHNAYTCVRLVIIYRKPDHSNLSEKISLKYSVCDADVGIVFEMSFSFPIVFETALVSRKGSRVPVLTPAYEMTMWKCGTCRLCCVRCYLPTLCVVCLNSSKLNKL